MLVASWGEPEVQQFVHCITQTVLRCTVYRIYHVHRLKTNITHQIDATTIKLLMSSSLLIDRLSLFHSQRSSHCLLIIIVFILPILLLFAQVFLHADLSDDLFRSLLRFSHSSLSIYKNL